MAPIITMAETVPGREIDSVVGTARGNVVRARFVGRDFLAGLRMLVGGEISEYTKLMAEAREQAMDRMAASTSEVFKSGILVSAISLSCALVTLPTLFLFGSPDPLGIPVVFLRRTAAGGVLVMKEKLRSA